ncbi:hypothetical protein NHG29_03070 [Aerococcaceae bacterium NML160702]|nr:hypothetical protein [Aerococcaceae bacterium NML160702]
MTTQEYQNTSGERMYTKQEIRLGIQEELGIDYIHFNMPDKLYTEEEYQAFKEYAKRLMDFNDSSESNGSITD